MFLAELVYRVLSDFSVNGFAIGNVKRSPIEAAAIQAVHVFSWRLGTVDVLRS